MERRRRVLILFAHPALQKSRVQRRLADAVRDLPGVTFHDLYEAYPELDLDVKREQARLVDHDVVVFQFPFYWYSTPAILKEWQDLVLEHGWAYGSNGTALRGKSMMCALSTGGGAAAYAPGGRNRFTIAQFLAPLDQTAHLCGMTFLEPFVVHGTHAMTPDAIAKAAVDYRARIEELTGG